jgi:hypothetical protein
MPLGQFDEYSPVVALATFDSTYVANTVVTLYTAGNVPTRLDAITAMNGDTSSRILDVYITPSGGPQTRIGTVTLAAGAGTLTTAVADVLASLTTTDQKWITLPAGASIALSIESTISSGKIVTVFARGGTM